MAQRRADERMAGITAAHRFRLGEQRPGWLAKSQAFSSVMKQERNLELIKQRSDARRAASEKETAAAPESAAEAPPPTPVAAPRLASPPPPPPLMAPQQWAPWAAPKPTAEDEPAAADDSSAVAVCMSCTLLPVFSASNQKSLFLPVAASRHWGRRNFLPETSSEHAVPCG